MNEKTLRALIDAGAVKRIRIIADGALFHVEADTVNGSITAFTLKGAVKTWRSLDTAAKWVRSLGIGTAQIYIAKWQPGQKGLGL
ncbi:MAG TPA: hypothetical protein EYH06_13420 [Chromatiales bacterium]|nr:hypothetical protein [Thiotrichales bacterium]HIP69564.1 hypothetical protein [Chromatiales bacterium]